MRIRLSVPISFSAIASVLDSPPPNQDFYIKYITFDSRLAESGDLFIALRGDNHDGAAFSQDVLAKNAYVIAEWGENITIQVQDIKNALLRLVEYYKSKLPCLKHTIAITGSVGKTTTRIFTKALLEAKYVIHSTEKNQNNYIGVALTVFSAPANTEVLLLEVGMNHIGEISEISTAIHPQISVITNVGTAHIGNLRSKENIAQAKLEILDGMCDGKVIIPQNEPLLENVPNKITVSLNDSKALCYLFPLSVTKYGSIFDFYSPQRIFLAQRLNIVGYQNLVCFAFALSVACTVGIGALELSNALKRIDSSILRQRRLRVGIYDIYDDTYSSSPEAVMEAMKMLTMDTSIRKSAVLGDMLELGEKSDEMHRAIGKCAYECGFSKLYLYGKYASSIAEGAEANNMDRNNIYINNDVTAPLITATQIKNTYNGELLLIKGSHALHMEKIITLLSE